MVVFSFQFSDVRKKHLSQKKKEITIPNVQMGRAVFVLLSVEDFLFEEVIKKIFRKGFVWK